MWATNVVRAFESRARIKPSPVFYQLTGNFKRKLPETHFGKMKEWTKPEIDAKVLEMLMGTATIAPEKVSLEAHLFNDLGLTRNDRFGVQDDLQMMFQFRIPQERIYARRLESGREMADWVAALLEEWGRLKY